MRSFLFECPSQFSYSPYAPLLQHSPVRSFLFNLSLSRLSYSPYTPLFMVHFNLATLYCYWIFPYLQNYSWNLQHEVLLVFRSSSHSPVVPNSSQQYRVLFLYTWQCGSDQHQLLSHASISILSPTYIKFNCKFIIEEYQWPDQAKENLFGESTNGWHSHFVSLTLITRITLPSSHRHTQLAQSGLGLVAIC